MLPLRFAKAVLAHWVALIGGSGLAVLLFVWEQSGGPDVPRQAFWLLIACGLVVAMFQAWTAERGRADKADAQLRDMTDGQPHAVLGIVVDSIYLLVEVLNEGARGRFTATIETIGGERTLQPMPAIWDLTNSHEPFEIPRSGRARLRIATCDEDRTYSTNPEDDSVIDPDYGWNLFYGRLPGHRGWHGGRRALDAPDALCSQFALS